VRTNADGFATVFGTGRGSPQAQADRDAAEKTVCQRQELNDFSDALVQRILKDKGFRRAITEEEVRQFAVDLAAPQRQELSVEEAVTALATRLWEANVLLAQAVGLDRMFCLITVLNSPSILPTACESMREVAQQAVCRFFEADFDDVAAPQFPQSNAALIAELYVKRWGGDDQYYQHHLGPISAALAPWIAKAPGLALTEVLQALMRAPADSLAEGGALNPWIGALAERLDAGLSEEWANDLKFISRLRSLLERNPPNTAAGAAFAPLRRYQREVFESVVARAVDGKTHDIS
jgi:hypothetical protein